MMTIAEALHSQAGSLLAVENSLVVLGTGSDNIALHRFGNPENVVRGVAFHVSDMLDYITRKTP
jgi:NAD(P)-dependent dehydrogenase (short-subunit alcohol dehydrogenase family)